jgi:predicted RNase H-like HicB family nuclease
MEARSLTRHRYLDLPYRIVLTREPGRGADRGWIAYVEELPGCEARGETADDAARAIREAMEEWMRTAVEEGRAIPRPRIAEQNNNGELSLTVPQSLHNSLIRAAVREGMPLQDYLTIALAAVVRWNPSGDEAEGGWIASRSRRIAALNERPERYWMRTAMIANVTLLALVAIAAIALLAVALSHGL